MFRKEWRDIQAPAWSRMAATLVFLVIPLAARESQLENLYLSVVIGFPIAAFWAANHMGFNAFRGEFRDEAFEYLLTFPFSGFGLLVRKLAPRAAFLAVLALIFAGIWKTVGGGLVFGQKAMPIFRSPLAFAGWLLFFFFCGFFLSLIDWGNLRPAVPLGILILWALCGVAAAAWLFPRGPERAAVYFSAGVVLTGFAGVFAVLWRRLRIRRIVGLVRRGATGRKAGRPAGREQPLRTGGYRVRKWIILRREWLFTARTIVIVLGVSWIVGRIVVRTGEALLDREMMQVATYGILLLCASFFSALYMFGREFRERALEYMLTFPLGRGRLLAEKSLARLVVIAPAFVLYIAMGASRHFPITEPSGLFLNPRFFGVWIVLLFLCGLFLSLFEMKNASAFLSLASFLPVFLVPRALEKAFPALTSAPAAGRFLAAASGMAAVCLILGVFFFRILPKYDLAAPRRYALRTGLSLISIFVAMSLASLAVLFV